ncbi:MAG: hypothetical protein ACKO3G_18235 [Planctomycetaceae bacterium]
MPIAIHQIFYDDAQRRRLDPAFIPHDNRANPDPAWREYHVFRTEYRAGRVRPGMVTGYVSWKFGRKTRLRGRAFVDFIARHPDHDVWFVNPPGLEPRSFPNVWIQGEHHHPGILGLARRVFRRCGIDCDPERLRQREEEVLFCNYWAGTRRFWDTYMAFCEPVRRCLLHGLDAHDRRLLHSRADRVIDATYVPFVMERLFSTLLSLRRDIAFRPLDARPWYAPARWLPRRRAA